MLLSIAIPTYNRASYLDRCLNSITRQIIGLNFEVELMVVDNASTDNTDEIVKKYIDQGFEIKYFKGEINKGIDFNILQCYHLSSAKYVVAFGDDDILYDGVLQCLEKLLVDDYGIIYIENNNIPSTNFNLVKVENAAFQFKSFDSPFKTLNTINYYITYTSGCIINKKYFDVNFDYVGCFVALTPCILKAILNSNKNAYVSTKCIGYQPENSGGYKLIDVFAHNLNEVMLKEIKDIRIVSCINKHLLLGFFSTWMILYKQNKKNYKHFFIPNEDPVNKLRIAYNGSFLFWFAIMPIKLLPIKLAKQYLRFLLLIRIGYTFFINNFIA